LCDATFCRSSILETVLFQIASVSWYYERKLKDFYIKE
jgi:hypothetical protein